MNIDKGSFKVVSFGSGVVNVYSEDFTFDAALRLSGDFPTQEEKERYARWVAAALNAAIAGDK
jgi:hypothetical protein